MAFKRFAEKFKSGFKLPRTVSKPPYGHVCQIGDPVLRKKALDVPVGQIMSEDIQEVFSLS